MADAEHQLWRMSGVPDSGPEQSPESHLPGYEQRSAADERSVQHQRGESWCDHPSGCGLEGFYTGQSRSQYFNLAAFAPTPVGAGRFGNAGVGILQGPGTAAVSLGVAKSFQITEGLHARFESTFTNVLNHTNFAPPATVVDSPSTFGQLIGAQTAENAGNRTGQLALRLDF